MSAIKTTIRLLVVLFLTFQTVDAQTNTVSHKVVKGDNVYRLSLRYGVSMEAIFQANSGSRDVIIIGETLTIPNKGQVNTQINTSNSSTYFVNKGDTKYGLSKRFKVSIAQLESANPEIVRMLMAGQTITIPKQGSSGQTVATRTTTSSNRSDTFHTVEKYETLSMIARRYYTSVDQLKALNKNLIGDDLEVGQKLVVEKNTADTTNAFYIVQRGDTKYGLSKRFNMTISELEQLNPEIIPMLRYDTKIKTSLNQNVSTTEVAVLEKKVSEDTIKEEKLDPEKTQVVSKEEEEEVVALTQTPTENAVTPVKDSTTIKPPKQDKGFEYYTIKPQETLYGLAKQANMTMDDFVILNPNIKETVIEGSIIKMPTNIKRNTPITASSAENGLSTTEADAKADLRTITVVWSDANSAFNKDIRDDYYLGMEKAIDSVVKIFPNRKLQLVADESYLEPISDSIVDDYSQFFMYPIEKLKSEDDLNDAIDVVSFTYKNKGITENFIVKGLPSEELMRIKVLDYLKTKDANIICLYDNNHIQKKSIIDSILPGTSFIPVNKDGTFNTDDLKELLKSKVKNYVILESDKIGVYLASTTLLLKEVSKTEIQLVVLDAKNIPQEGAVAEKRFKILNLLYPLPYNYNISNGLSKSTAVGFAMNFDLLRRFNKNGLKDLDNNEATTTFGFTFKYMRRNGIYENIAVMLFIYDKNSNTTQIN
ncbi:MAG: LysM peptidoglycan-binding domain-containing protein [Psychroserpens sp.]|uniref:LysM peptidoglycan-binding domain-containing protein n=1 Tax=Psychroserpens sp. TaxID=2020870 RepID=UPI003C719482